MFKKIKVGAAGVGAFVVVVLAFASIALVAGTVVAFLARAFAFGWSLVR